MAKQLTPDSEFLVKEERVLNYILAALFLGLFLYGVVDLIVKNFKGLTYVHGLFALALLPAWLSFRKARSKTIYIRINKKGIYTDEKLLTDWQHFLNAYLSQKKNSENASIKDSFSIQDNFQMIVEYMKDGSNKGFRRNIPLTNTQNQSEEDILAAVKYFYSLKRKEL